MKIEGDIFFHLVKSNGEVVREHRKNRVTQAGIELIMNRLITGTGPDLDTLVVGSGVTPNTGLESALNTQVSSGLVTNTIMTSSPPIGGAVQVHGKVNLSAAANITECGIYAGSVLFSRAVFSSSPIIAQADDYFDIAWVISFNSV